MNTHVLLTLLLPALLIGGCNNKTKNSQTNTADSTFAAAPISTTDYYFAGEYRNHQGNATLQDNATGTILSISNGELASQLAKEYSALKLPANQTAIAQLYGRLTPTHEVEQNPRSVLVVTRIVSLHPHTNATIARPLTGDYITYVPNNIKPSERFTFTLHPDYSYTFSIYNLSANSTRSATGTWHLLRDNYIQFTNNPLTNFTSEAFVNNDNTELTFKTSKRIYYKQE